MKKFLLLICITIFTINVIEAQSAKKLLRIGNKQLKENQIQEAQASLTHAIKLDANLVEAYASRADAYTRLGKKDEAIADLDMVNKLDVKNAEAWLKNGNLNYNKEDYTKAATKYAGYLNLETKDLSIYDREIDCLKTIEDYSKALFYAKKKLEVKESSETYFEIASLEYFLKNYSAAETNYRNALKDSPNNIDYHNGLALALYYQDRYDAAINETNQVLRKDKSNKMAFLTRANSYHKKIEYTYAINDISKVIVLYPNDDDILDNINFRGDLYLEFSQHMNAISDYSRVISKDPDNTYALYKRAEAYEEITRKDEAVKDFARIVAIAGTGAVVADDIFNGSKTKLYNLKRESNAPIVELTNKDMSDGNIRATFDMQDIELNIHVKDDNAIKSVMVDGTALKVKDGANEANFTTTVSLVDKDKIVVTAKDTYDNKSNTEFYIQRVENDPPVVSFMIPYTNENNEMILEGDDSRVYFEGNVKDESLIKSISIDDVLIPFNTEELNPSFSTNLDLQNKTSILIKVTDIYDNVAQQEYFLNREDALYMAESPMGKTWVVFLENSDYESFASLDGPVKDIRLMKTALANYEVHNIIQRKDLTKAQMDRFFSIELRDLVKKNHVNSLVVWYAGHGKFQNETGYWIPIDADRNDEFSYYNINNLKAAMQVYNTELTHTLVVTDACESGPSFYQAMRGEIQVRDCGDESAIKFKSSQVFSSAGYELASDNSQFTKTFANSLENNSDQCIPIESIVLKVDDAFSQDKQQKPQFGKISGLVDENGTFFFIKRQTGKPTPTPADTTDQQEK
jgi:tetratricopeptide (TPR) repeat protein